MAEQQSYITLEDAAIQLEVTRATLYYYLRTLSIPKHKFPLDRRAYMTVADFERIRSLKEEARQRRGEPLAAEVPPPEQEAA